MFDTINKMVQTRRLEHTAKMARDLILGVRAKCMLSRSRRRCLRNLSQVDVSGFGFGGHAAGLTCQYLLEKTGEKVRMLLGTCFV